jgi:septation ring formation regulator EzrA
MHEFIQYIADRCTRTTNTTILYILIFAFLVIVIIAYISNKPCSECQIMRNKNDQRSKLERFQTLSYSAIKDNIMKLENLNI